MRPNTHPLSGDQYRLLVEHAPVMIWRSSLDTLCDYFNETWLAFTGRTMEQEMGNGWTEGVHPDDFDRCVEIYLRHFERREAFEMDYRLRRHDGVYRWIFDRGVPYTDDSGEFAGFIGSCVDIHERKELDRAKATFLAMLAHEQRTPLMASKAYLELIRRRVGRGLAVQESVLDKLGGQIDRLDRLVGDLSETARLEQGRPVDIAPYRIDLCAVLQQVVDMREESVRQGVATDRGHRIHLDMPQTPLLLQGDPQRLEQVFWNLLDNAVKYSPQGGDIDIVLKEYGDSCRVSIRDSGIGVPRSEVPQLGRRYFRASNASPEQFPGIGLGLAVSREIVERHGGQLVIDSTPTMGTTVEVVLPVA